MYLGIYCPVWHPVSSPVLVGSMNYFVVIITVSSPSFSTCTTTALYTYFCIQLDNLYTTTFLYESSDTIGIFCTTGYVTDLFIVINYHELFATKTENIIERDR
ncbi:hypothetical protein AA313_de0203530 [Arthrobotrys entomopaga]|nr:hypothetical protein AA313_de0203530 [Arthrobotrys entomopaga]